MKTNGYRIEIEKDLGLTDKYSAIRFANEFIGEVTVNGNWNHLTGGGWKGGRHWPIQRGVYGKSIGGSPNLVFRRASKNKRIFQIVNKKHLIFKEPDKVSDCVCIEHLGGLKVKNQYGDIDCYTYYETGSIGQ